MFCVCNVMLGQSLGTLSFLLPGLLSFLPREEACWDESGGETERFFREGVHLENNFCL